MTYICADVDGCKGTNTIQISDSVQPYITLLFNKAISFVWHLSNQPSLESRCDHCFYASLYISAFWLYCVHATIIVFLSFWFGVCTSGLLHNLQTWSRPARVSYTVWLAHPQQLLLPPGIVMRYNPVINLLPFSKYADILHNTNAPQFWINAHLIPQKGCIQSY